MWKKSHPLFKQCQSISAQCLFHGFKVCHSLLPSGADVAHNAGIFLCTFNGSEAAGYFLFHLAEADGSFSFVVGKWHWPICSETKNICLIFPQTFQQTYWGSLRRQLDNAPGLRQALSWASWNFPCVRPDRQPLLRWIYAGSWGLILRSRRWKGAQSCFCLFYGGSFLPVFGWAPLPVLWVLLLALSALHSVPPEIQWSVTVFFSRLPPLAPPAVLDMHIIQRFDIGGKTALFYIIFYSSFCLWKILKSWGRLNRYSNFRNVGRIRTNFQHITIQRNTQ